MLICLFVFLFHDAFAQNQNGKIKLIDGVEYLEGSEEYEVAKN